jgi:hypothetical protein
MKRTAPVAKPTAIVEIERLGFDWTEVAEYDLTQLVTYRDPKSGRVQVREVTHYAPKEAVEQYAVAMGETPFPPIVVTADHWIIDGNTRVAARFRRKEKFAPAIVLSVYYEQGSDKQRSELYALAATLNQTGGQRLTAKEIRSAAARLIALNWKTEQIGRAIGAKSSTVTQVKREIAATEKLRRVGMDPNTIGGASLRALGATKVVGLNDSPFRELAQLSVDAGFNAGEVTSTARELMELASDASAVARLSELRTELGDRIRERELTGVGKPPVSRQLRQHLGYVTKFAGREDELIETNPAVGQTHIDALQKSINVLTEALHRQKGE